MHGGLRVYNESDPVPLMGFAGLSLAAVASEALASVITPTPASFCGGGGEVGEGGEGGDGGGGGEGGEGGDGGGGGGGSGGEGDCGGGSVNGGGVGDGGGGGSGGAAAHGGVSVPLLNDNLTRANPYTNHLRYAVDSFELCPEQPCLRVRYMLPGLAYSPDIDATRIAPSPKLALPPPAPPPQPQPPPVGAAAAAAAAAASGAAAAACEVDMLVATETPPREESLPAVPPTWRTRSGRATGSNNYQFGDFSRSLLQPFLRGARASGLHTATDAPSDVESTCEKSRPTSETNRVSSDVL